MRSTKLTPLVLDAPGQMALDEAVLTESAPDAVVLRVYDWAGHACTFGYSLAFSDVRAACDGRGWKDIAPVRRSTGGGIVFHDGDLTFSLVFPWDRTCAPDTIYKNIHRGIHQALKANGMANGLWSPERKPEGIAQHCFSRPEKMDIVDDAGKKILGGALRKKGTKGLYQGSLRADVPKAVVIDGIEREFGRPLLAMRPEWLDAGLAIETRYRSAQWNERR